MNPVGHERSDRRHQATDLQQSLVQRVLAGSLVVAVGLVPEPAARASHIPVGEVINDEVLEPPAGLVEVPRLEVLVVRLCHRARLRQHPAVERAALRHSDVARLVVGIETVQCGVIGVEAVDVPQCEEHLGVGLSNPIRVEIGGRPRRALRGHVPTDRVSALLVEVVPRVDDVALRLAHLLAFLVQDVA